MAPRHRLSVAPRRSFAIAAAVAGFAALIAAWLVLPGCGGSAPRMYSEAPRLAAGAVAPEPALQAPPPAHGGTDYVNDAAYDAMFLQHYGTNPFVDADEDPLSTFAVDVDTGSYTLARSYLDRGHLPPGEAVRVEEFLNYFDYGYAPPESDAFALHLAAAPSPYGDGKLLFRVGIKAREVRREDRRPAILTFVVDVSGSMAREDRLGLVKKALHLLVDQMQEGDEVGIAVYGSRGRSLLQHTSDTERIRAAIDALEPEGATNAEEGLRIGYRMASKAFRKGAINHVVLCSDGVANVGRTGPESVLEVIKQERAGGITLSTVGFGMGNYNDVLMERLADTGDGRYAYVDSPAEARRLFVEELTGTLQVVARDMKVQVEFFPEVVRSYRLLGYENRDVADRDFRNDVVDGGEVGAGHSVTALYEIKRWPDRSGRLATVRVRHKDADEPERVTEVERSIATADAARRVEDAPADLRLAACVAEFAEVLRGSYWARGRTAADLIEPTRSVAKAFDDERVRELASLVEKAAHLAPEKVAQAEAPADE